MGVPRARSGGGKDALDRDTELMFDARGLLHHEARLSADLRVSNLPEGMDPDEIVLRDKEEWQRIISQAQPIITHVLEMLVSQRDISDPKTKSEIAARILPLVRDVPNPVERDLSSAVARVSCGMKGQRACLRQRSPASPLPIKKNR